MKRIITAIDFGTSKVTTIAGQKVGGSTKIIGYSVAPSNGVIRGEVVNIQKVITSVQPTIRDVESQIGQTITEVYVGISGQQIHCKTIHTSRNRNRDELVSAIEIDNMIKDIYNSKIEDDEIILNVIPQSYNVGNYQEVDPIGMSGPEIEGSFLAIIGKKNLYHNISLVLEKLKLKLKRIIINPIASASAVLSEDEKEVGVAMVDIGAGTSDLLVCKDNIVKHTAIIPFAGKSVTDDIRLICKVSLRNSEKIKKYHGTCIADNSLSNQSISMDNIGSGQSQDIPLRLISSVIEARIAEIFETLKAELENNNLFQYTHRGLVLTGGSSHLTHIHLLAEKILGLKVRIASPSSPNILSNSVESVFSKEASTAVGLIIEGIKDMGVLADEEVENEADTADYGSIFTDKEYENDEPKERKKKNVKKKEKRKSLKDRLAGFFDIPDDNEA
ncbi:MAG: cell division protein FtsA [Bacteroidales bacterium]